MTDSVGRFVVGIEADPSGLAAGLKASADQIKQFADAAEADFTRANTVVAAAAPLNAQALQIQTLIAQHRALANTIQIEGEQTATAFRESTDALASQLTKLGATERELDTLGKSIQIVERRYVAMAVAANAAATTRNFGTQFLQTGTLTVPTVSPGQISGLAATATSLGNIGINSGRAGISLDRLRLPLTTIADHALGASRAFGSLSSGILSIGFGTGPTIALIATIGALALAYQKLTADSTKAREELDKLIKSLDEAANKRVDVIITMSLDTATLEKEQSRLQKEAAQLQQSLSSAALTASVGLAGVGGGADAFAGSKRQADIKRLTEITKALGEIQASVRDNDIKTTNESAAALAALIKGQTASNRERQVGLDLLAQNKRLVADLSATEESFAAAGAIRTPKQIADLQRLRVEAQRNVEELTAAFKVQPDKTFDKFLTDLEKRATDVAAAMKLITESTKFGKLPTADFSVLPQATVKAYNDAVAAATKLNLTLDQRIRLEEIITKLQNTRAVLLDEAKRAFGPEGSAVVIPPVFVSALLDIRSLSTVGQQIQDFTRIPQTVPLTLVPEFPPSVDNRLTADLSTFLDKVKRAEGDKLVLDVALQLGPSGRDLADQIRTQAASSLEAAQEAGAFVLTNIGAFGLSAAEQVKAIQRVRDALRGLAGDAKEVQPPDLGLQAFIVAGRGILDIANGFGKVDSNARQAVRGILDAATALGEFNKARAAGSVLGTISGGLGIVGGIVAAASGIAALFSKGDAERKRIQDEANRVLADNNRHLDELGLKIAGWIGSIPDLQKVAASVNAGGTDAVLAHIRDLAARDTALAGANKTVEPNRAAFDAFLKGTGISLSQLEAAAHQVGIVLYDQAGRIIPGAFAQLQDAIRLTIQDMTHFQNTLQDQRALADLHANVFDLKLSPIEVVDSWLDTFKKLAPQGFAQIFGGVNVTNAAAVKKAEQDFVKGVEAGTIDLAKLGISKDEFIAIITGMETGFDAVTNAANALTQSLTNVPAGFKVAAFEFAAAATEARRQIGTTPGTTTGPGTTALTQPFFPGGSTKPSVSASFSFSVAPGAIVVHAAPGMDPKQTADAVFSQLRLLARTTGDATIKRFVTSLPS